LVIENLLLVIANGSIANDKFSMTNSQLPSNLRFGSAPKPGLNGASLSEPVLA
jgi:hypothetical protein